MKTFYDNKTEAKITYEETRHTKMQSFYTP